MLQQQSDEIQYRPLVQGVTDHAIVMLGLDGRLRGWNAGAEPIKDHKAEGSLHEIVFGATIVSFLTREAQGYGRVATFEDITERRRAGRRERAAGLDQVNTAIDQMEKVTRQNAAMAVGSTAARHMQADKTQELGELIGRFHLGQEAVGAGAPAGSRRRRDAERGGVPKSSASETSRLCSCLCC